MNTAALLTAVLQFGPTIVPLVAKLVADIEAGKGAKIVTSADLAELVRLGNLTAADVFKAQGVTFPLANPA